MAYVLSEIYFVEASNHILLIVKNSFEKGKGFVVFFFFFNKTFIFIKKIFL